MRVLVVHGSADGGTAGLAEMVALALLHHDVEVDLGPAADVGSVEGYDVVVIGGGLHRGRWHRDAVEFVECFADDLRAVAVWLFSSGPLDDSARDGSLAPVAQVQRLARGLEARGHMTFGGCGRRGDFRDPAQVAEWAARIARSSRPVRPAGAAS